MVHMFHSFYHFWRKSTVRNSMVIFCFSFSPKATTKSTTTFQSNREEQKIKPLMSCAAWIFLFIKLFVSPNDGRLSFSFVDALVDTYINGLKMSLKVTNSVVVYVIYAWFFSPIWFMESTLFRSSFKRHLTCSALLLLLGFSVMITKWTKQWTIKYRKSHERARQFLMVLVEEKKVSWRFSFLVVSRQWNFTLI